MVAQAPTAAARDSGFVLDAPAEAPKLVTVTKDRAKIQV
jgi:hypothetical protein